MPCRTPGGALLVAMLFAATSFAAGTAQVREQKSVVIGGQHETWRLLWAAAPAAACAADEIEAALSCSCSGFAYGETGQLSLLRIPATGPGETLELAQFYIAAATPAPPGSALLQRWQPIPASASDEDDDWHHASDFNFLKRVQARRTTDAMRIADYNHDGQASEFLLQVGVLPCGRPQLLLVGVSRRNPHLHVFAAADAGDQPLLMGPRAWAAVLKNPRARQVVEWPCGTDADSVESVVDVEVRRGVFHLQRSERHCANPP